jgi:membrane protein implicated in regulation of membrane protease activity
MVYKYSFIVVAIFACIYGAFWTFNHINAWLGIALFIVVSVFLIDKLFKLLKNNNNA